MFQFPCHCEERSDAAIKKPPVEGRWHAQRDGGVKKCSVGIRTRRNCSAARFVSEADQNARGLGVIGTTIKENSCQKTAAFSLVGVEL